MIFLCLQVYEDKFLYPSIFAAYLIYQANLLSFFGSEVFSKSDDLKGIFQVGFSWDPLCCPPCTHKPNLYFR